MGLAISFLVSCNNGDGGDPSQIFKGTVYNYADNIGRTWYGQGPGSGYVWLRSPIEDSSVTQIIKYLDNEMLPPKSQA